MSNLIRAIEWFEAALQAGDPAEREEAEAVLFSTLWERAEEDHHEVCEPAARGCTEGVSYRGTVYATGFGPDGEPCVVLIRRVRPAAPAPAPAGDLLAEAGRDEAARN